MSDKKNLSGHHYERRSMGEVHRDRGMTDIRPSNERCINWPCAMRKGHVGPCSTSPEQRSSKQEIARQLREWYESGWIRGNTLTQKQAELLWAAIGSLTADEPKATDEGVADARRWIAYLESEPQHEPDISIARVLRDLVQFYEWALPQITNRTADEPSALLLVPCPRCGGTGKLKPYKLEGDTEWRVADCPEKHVTAEPPPAVDVAPIAKLTVRDGLVQRAGLYAPGLPDGDHDVFPVPLSPKGELRPHVLAEPPSDVQRDAERWRALIGCARVRVMGSAGIHDPKSNYAHIGVEFWTHHKAQSNPRDIETILKFVERAARTKDAGECGACDKPGEHR